MISVCILTKNASATLRETLESVRIFDEVIVLDNGSTDDTLQIAEGFPNVKVHTFPFIGFGPLRNEAAQFAKNDWILVLDSDEVLSPELMAELKGLQLNPTQTYSVPRHNYYNNKRIKGCGWGSEQIARLYHRQFAKYSPSQVHERLEATHVTPLKSPILHTPYRSTADFLAKMQQYSTLFAEQYRGKKRSSFAIALMHALFAFFRSYILKRGLFCGREGFLISVYNANTALYKYLKLAELNKNRCF
ncbi:MAG: glycosyltransferase family 2 protein [Verrucomicrobia bacterium]|nr:glycosyltransferase family 2 protein [Verrucomicrobiota bacterium]MDE3047281.1 glycosyltransferase family 2 protein [Verrucomicrobiota bacterium]